MLFVNKLLLDFLLDEVYNLVLPETVEGLRVFGIVVEVAFTATPFLDPVGELYGLCLEDVVDEVFRFHHGSERLVA